MAEKDERREYDRLCKSFQVSVRKFEFPLSSQDRNDVRCLNISAGGMLLECPQKYDQGDKLETTIRIPNLNKFHPGFFKVFENDFDQSLVAVAEVVRSEKRQSGAYELGLRFIDVYEDDWKALHNMIVKMM